MGKRKRKREQRPPEGGTTTSLWSSAQITACQAVTATADDAPSLLSATELSRTARTLAALRAQPQVLRAREARAIRAQIFALAAALQQGATGSNDGPDVGAGKNLGIIANNKLNQTNLSGRVGDAIHEGRWEDAVILLEQLIVTCGAVKLGALQRWVRDIFASDERVAPDSAVAARTLNAVLRACGFPARPSREVDDDDNDDDNDEQTGDRGAVEYEMWKAFDKRTGLALCDDNVLPQVGQSACDAAAALGDKWVPPAVRVISKDDSWRTGMTIFGCGVTSADLFIHHDNEKNLPAVQRFDCPLVPGCSMLSDVFSAAACRRVVQTAESMGFTPEASYSLNGKPTPSAEGCVWMTDGPLNDALFDRVRHMLPKTVAGAGELTGLNPRWRLYRYSPWAIYRPHIDGCWTGSGYDPTTGALLDDAHGDRSSRFTFLLYLCDDFEEGGTSFFFPSEDEEKLSAVSVAPLQGCVLLFPHGNDVPCVGLVHEGSKVKRGFKYVVRTEVLYRHT